MQSAAIWRSSSCGRSSRRTASSDMVPREREVTWAQLCGRDAVLSASCQVLVNLRAPFGPQIARHALRLPLRRFSCEGGGYFYVAGVA
jgi:hypothetical protein